MPTRVTPDGTAVPDTLTAPEPEQLSVDDIATRLLTLRVLKERVAEIEGDLRAQGLHAFRIGDQVPGYLSDDDAAEGRFLGRVGMSKPGRDWKVTDPEKLAAWVAEHAPDELETRPVVRNSFIGLLRAQCIKQGGWVSPDGELLTPGGMEMVTGRPSLVVRASPEAAELVAVALAEGRLHFDGTPALPAGGAA